VANNEGFERIPTKIRKRGQDDLFMLSRLCSEISLFYNLGFYSAAILYYSYPPHSVPKTTPLITNRYSFT
jgi:hypothetical protein